MRSFVGTLFALVCFFALSGKTPAPAVERTGATIFSHSSSAGVLCFRKVAKKKGAKQGNGQNGPKNNNNNNKNNNNKPQGGANKNNKQRAAQKANRQQAAAQAEAQRAANYASAQQAAARGNSAKALADRALEAAAIDLRAVKKEVSQHVSKLNHVKQTIEDEQPESSPVKKAKAELDAAKTDWNAFLSSSHVGEADPQLAKAIARGRLKVAEENYRKAQDEMYKADSRWVVATAPLREALYRKGNATKILETRRIERLVLSGPIAGIYQPAPQDPATAQQLVRNLKAKTQAALEAFKQGSREPWKVYFAAPVAANAAYSWNNQFRNKPWRRNGNRYGNPNRPNRPRPYPY